MRHLNKDRLIRGKKSLTTISVLRDNLQRKIRRRSRRRRKEGLLDTKKIHRQELLENYKDGDDGNTVRMRIQKILVSRRELISYSTVLT